MKFPREFVFCIAIGGGPLKDADDWLKFAEHHMRGDRSQATISMEIKAETWERKLQIRADVEGDDQALVFIDSPAKEKGIGTLRLKNSMWNWFPKLTRKATVSPSMLLASWMGSDFTNDDLLKASSMSKDYVHKFTPDETLNGETYKVIENKAKSDAKVMWPKIITLASSKDCLPRIHRYYDKQGNLIRVMTLSDMQEFDGHIVPRIWEMVPQNGNGKKTVLTYEKVGFKPKFPPNHFTMQALTNE